MGAGGVLGMPGETCGATAGADFCGIGICGDEAAVPEDAAAAALAAIGALICGADVGRGRVCDGVEAIGASTRGAG